MNVQELATAVEEELPVKVLLLDNASLGMVRQQQDLFWGGRRTRRSTSARAPDWELLARAFGVAARSIGDADEVEDALAETLAEPGPALLHVRDRARGQLPADVPPGRRRAGDDRLDRRSQTRRRRRRRRTGGAAHDRSPGGQAVMAAPDRRRRRRVQP